MIYDSNPVLGVDDFCRHCRICAETCPSGAISHGDKKIIRGVERYPFKALFLTGMERLIYGDYNPRKYPHPEWMEESPAVWEKYRFGRKKR
jgi:ferredoxin